LRIVIRLVLRARTKYPQTCDKISGRFLEEHSAPGGSRTVEEELPAYVSDLFSASNSENPSLVPRSARR
jgi:hypothetical protein